MPAHGNVSLDTQADNKPLNYRHLAAAGAKFLPSLLTHVFHNLSYAIFTYLELKKRVSMRNAQSKVENYIYAASIIGL